MGGSAMVLAVMGRSVEAGESPMKDADAVAAPPPVTVDCAGFHEQYKYKYKYKIYL